MGRELTNEEVKKRIERGALNNGYNFVEIPEIHLNNIDTIVKGVILSLSTPEQRLVAKLPYDTTDNWRKNTKYY
jgi:hypothetical protein